MSKNHGIIRPYAGNAWLNNAYDDRGSAVTCEWCDGELKWNPIMEEWYCEDCERTMNRRDYMNYIGAEPPGPHCLVCCENYPLCKQWCEHYVIDPNDPMLE